MIHVIRYLIKTSYNDFKIRQVHKKSKTHATKVMRKLFKKIFQKSKIQISYIDQFNEIIYVPNNKLYIINLILLLIYVEKY